MLILTEEDLKQINNFIQELPLKHGLPLFNFLNEKILEQNKSKEIITEEIKS
jgi:hypothetical protein